MPLVTLPEDMRRKAVEGIPNLLADGPALSTLCPRCGSPNSGFRYASSHEGVMARVEDCLDCGAEKSSRQAVNVSMDEGTSTAHNRSNLT